MGQSIRAWIGLTAVVALLVVVAGWFLVISPTRANTAETRAIEQSEQDRSIALTKALETLRTQFASLDESKAELDALKVQIPTTAETADFRRLLSDRAAQSGVTILSISTDIPTAADASAAGAAAASTTAPGDSASTSATPTPTPEAVAAPAPAAPTTSSGEVLVGIPMEIAIVGSYGAVKAFIASLQTTEGRLFVISGLGLVSQLDSPASAGRPETVKGDVEVAVQGLLLALTPSTADAADTSDASPAPSPSPLPTTERNPFVPVG